MTCQAGLPGIMRKRSTRQKKVGEKRVGTKQRGIKKLLMKHPKWQENAGLKSLWLITSVADINFCGYHQQYFWGLVQNEGSFSCPILYLLSHDGITNQKKSTVQNRMKKENVFKVTSICKDSVLQSSFLDHECNLEFNVANIFMCVSANKDPKRRCQ